MDFILINVMMGLVFISTTAFIYMAVDTGQQYMTLYKSTFEETADLNMADMFMFIDPSRLFLLNILAIVLVPLVLEITLGNPLVSGISFLLMIILPWISYSIIRKRRLKQFENQLPDALQMISGAIKAGASLNMAMEALVREQPAPMNQEIALFIRMQRIGVGFNESLEALERRLPIPDFQMLTAALRISREIGGNLAEVLEQLADTLRKKMTMEGKIESLTSQGKMQGIVMAGLPILLAVLLFFIEPEAMQMLYTTPTGWAVLGVIIVMEAAGYMFIQKITRIDV